MNEETEEKIDEVVDKATLVVTNIICNVGNTLFNFFDKKKTNKSEEKNNGTLS